MNQRTNLGVAVSFIVVCFLAIAPAIASADYVEIETPDSLIEDGYIVWNITAGDLVGITYPNTIAHKPFCANIGYDTCSESSSGTNGVTTESDIFAVGFSSTTDAFSGVYYYTLSAYNPDTNFNECEDKDCYYFKYNWDNTSKTVSTVFDNLLTTYTRFTDLEVSGSASSTIFDISYFLDTSEFNQNNQPNTVVVDITNIEQSQVAQKKKLVLPLVDGSASTTISIVPQNYLGLYSTSTELTDGEYTAWVKFFNFNTNNYVLPAEITANFTIEDGIVSEFEIVSQSDGLLPDNWNFTSQPCGITDIGGCIINALAFTFMPSGESLNEFKELNDKIAGKFPFAYLYDFQDSITALFNSSPTETLTIAYDFAGLGELTLLSQEQLEAVPYSIFIRDTLGYILWIMFAVQMYRRTQRIFNQNSV